MDMVVEMVGDVAVVSPRGQYLVISNSEEFKRDISPVVDENLKVLLDMSQLQFVDSSGLGAILSALRRLSARGGDLKLCGMSKAVRELLEITRMHRIFDIYGNREEAIASFQKESA